MTDVSLRLFSYEITVGALGIVYAILVNVLLQRNQLLPPIVITGALILFVLTLTGMIEEAIELFGPSGASSACANYGLTPNGATVETLAYLATNNICECFCRQR